MTKKSHFYRARLIAVLGAGWFLFANTASGQGPSQPYRATTTEAKVTIAVTSTFQVALTANTARKGCTIQFIGGAGTSGFVFLGSVTPADTSTSFKLTVGQSLNCAIGGIGLATDQILVTGTQNDVFVISSQ